MFDKKPRYLEVSYRARIWLESLLVLGKLKARNMHYKFKFFTRNPRKNSSQGDRMSGVFLPYKQKKCLLLSFCLFSALSIRCEQNEMSSTACRALKKLGQCHKRFVALKCCRTCKKKKNSDRGREKALRRQLQPFLQY